ncbi:MAG: hypothetical protein JW725_04835 [Candidatus Babeliaceae bacterium]|nr:hypothetical protein [Candidatus Babeliaceae bacterium]
MRYGSLILIAGTGLVLIFIYLNHQNQLTSLSYQKQRLELHLSQLREEHNRLKQQLAMLKQHDSVKERAMNELGLMPLSVTQVEQFIP